MLFHSDGSGRAMEGGLFSFFTSCFGSHSFVDQGLSVCVLWARHEDSAGSGGESVEHNLTSAHEGSLWTRSDRKRPSLWGKHFIQHVFDPVTSCFTLVDPNA